MGESDAVNDEGVKLSAMRPISDELSNDTTPEKETRSEEASIHQQRWPQGVFRVTFFHT